MTIYVCAGDTDSILTAVYTVLEREHSLENVKLQIVSSVEPLNYEFFSEYIEVEKNTEIAGKVVRELGSYSQDILESVLFACDYPAGDRADAICRFLYKVRKYGKYVINKLQDEDVGRIFEYRRYASNEVHHYKGFLRFSETPDGVLLAGYAPKADITAALAHHFIDRFPCESLVIVDLVRNKAGFYSPSTPFFIAPAGSRLLAAAAACAGEHSDFAELWREYVENISIAERKNIKLQNQNMRMRFREQMTEFRRAAT